MRHNSVPHLGFRPGAAAGSTLSIASHIARYMPASDVDVCPGWFTFSIVT